MRNCLYFSLVITPREHHGQYRTRWMPNGLIVPICRKFPSHATHNCSGGTEGTSEYYPNAATNRT